jgi:hypothetical protein
MSQSCTRSIHAAKAQAGRLPTAGRNQVPEGLGRRTRGTPGC